MASANYDPARAASKGQHVPKKTLLHKDEGLSAEITHLQALNAVMYAQNAELKAHMNNMQGTISKLESHKKMLTKKNNALGQENKKMEDQLLFAHVELVWATREVSRLSCLVGEPAVESWGETAGTASVPLSAAGKPSDPRLVPLSASLLTSCATMEMTDATTALGSLAHTDTKAPVIGSIVEAASMSEQAKKNAGDAGKRRAGEFDDKETEEEKWIVEKERNMAPGDPRRTKRQKTSHPSEG